MKSTVAVSSPIESDGVRGWFQRAADASAATHIAFLFAFAFAGLFAIQFIPLLNTLPRPELNLAGQWEVCVPKSNDVSSCAWTQLTIPADVPAHLLKDFQGWAVYRTRFTAPASCMSASGACAFFFQEIGDSAEASLNGHVIGRHGQFPPNAVYAKHYPVRFQISRDSLRSGEQANELLITAYSMKKTQAGVRAPPIGIYSVEDSFRLAQRFTTINVVNPVLAFVALFMIAALSLAAVGPELSKDPKLAAFIRFGLASSCFLLSISEVPREYLPIGLAGYLHFSLRILHDWSFFELVASYFDYKPSFVRKMRPLYVLTLVAFFVQFIVFFVAGVDSAAHTGRGFDVGFLTLRIALPILILPHVMGLYSAFKRRKTWEGRVALPLFAVTFLFQVHDSAIFHGYMSGTYYVKWYPLVIGVVFGLFFQERAREARAKARVEQEQANQMKMIHEATVGLAHDLEEPFKSVEMGFIELQRNPGNHEIIKALAETFPKKIKRVYELNRAILSYSKELSTALTLEREQVNLKNFLTEIADEFRPQPALGGVELSVVVPDDALIEIDPAKMRRVFRNLIRNAADACAGRPGSRITLEVRSNREGLSVLVSDNGPGIPAKIRDRLFQPFETFGKENGTGLGLAMARRLVIAHGGTLDLIESPSGACFRVLMV